MNGIWKKEEEEDGLSLSADFCLFRRTFSAKEQCFSLTTNQPTVLKIRQPCVNQGSNKNV
jgi:hypothetical protein